MAINIEVKHALRALEARIKALEDRPQSIISKETLEELARMEASFRQDAAPQVPNGASHPNHDGSAGRSGTEESVPTRLKVETPTVAAPKKMCPKCGVKPAYFFHVRSCKG